MKIEQDDVLIAYYKNTMVRFRRSREHQFSWFGGPAEDYPSGVAHGPGRLHHVATLWGHHLPGLEDQYGLKLPLYYGFIFSGCFLRYQLCTSDPRLKLLLLDPTESMPDFPYESYPTMFPYYPLLPSPPEDASPDTLSEITQQPVEMEPDDLTIIFPCQYDLGVSIWGPSGDAEGVQVIFQFDTKTKTMSVSNICT